MTPSSATSAATMSRWSTQGRCGGACRIVPDAAVPTAARGRPHAATMPPRAPRLRQRVADSTRACGRRSRPRTARSRRWRAGAGHGRAATPSMARAERRRSSRPRGGCSAPAFDAVRPEHLAKSAGLVVAARSARDAVADRGDAYVAAAFDTLAGAAGRSANPLAAISRPGCATPPRPRRPPSRPATAYLTRAWKGDDQQGDR